MFLEGNMPRLRATFVTGTVRELMSHRQTDSEL